MQNDTVNDAFLLFLLLVFTRLGQCAHRIDTIQLICGVNKVTGFYHCVKSVCIRSFSSPYFPAFGVNAERYGVSLYFPAFGLEKLRIWTLYTQNGETDLK